ncbi:MAG: PLP-dependent aminotransferase family protein [Nonomuraea sp.]|nr:PLP-dependent aminotransferase family protein [Nonomuraea sp.]
MEACLDRFADESELAVLLGDWAAGPGPLYQKLAQALRSVIVSGELLPGFLLPAERRLAKALEVSRATVVGAYDLMREEGLLTRRVGSGTRVDPRVRQLLKVPDGRVRHGGATALVQRLVDGPGRVLSLAAADNGLDVADELVEAMREVAGDLPGLLAESGYHPRGLPALRAALAAFHSETGLPTLEDQIVVTTGATQALVLITQMYAAKGSVVVVEQPSWPGCLDIFRSAGAELVSVPLDEDGIRPDLLADVVSATGPALVYLMPNYHNPTGILMSGARRRRVAQIAADHGVPLIEDCATGLGSDLPVPVAGLAPAGGEVLTIGSLSKSLWSGLRAGWVRAPIPVAGRLARYKAMADMGSSLLPQAVAARVLAGLSELSTARAKTQRARRERLEELLRECLPEWRWRTPEGGSALWIELPGVDGRAFVPVALRHGVEVVPGAMADPAGGHDTYIRLPCTFADDDLPEVVARLAAAWRRIGDEG